MLHLVFSNRTEALIDALVARVRLRRPGRHGPTIADDGASDPAGMLALAWGEVPVLVPSAAMRRALALAVADAQGVCAGLRFVFLGNWLWEQVAECIPGVSPRSPFDLAGMTWRVYEWLGDGDHIARHPRLAAYMERADEVMRLELAERVAAQLEQAVTYRPDWLARWRLGESVCDHADEAWHADVWRDLAESLAPDPAHPIERFIAEMVAPDAAPPGSTEVHVFALPSMPPLYLQALAAMAQHRPVHVYILNPCREYWFELVGPKRLSYLQRSGREHGYEVGNTLLAAWGRQTQAAIDGWMSLDTVQIEDEDRFVEPAGEGLLARVQRAILNLAALEPGGLAFGPPEQTKDRSLEIHVAHSRLRELEVLHSRLLGVFADDPSLQPSDVLVVVPDLEESAPLIDAVFGTAPPERHIPFSITGLPRSRVNLLARALLDSLALARSRAPVSELDALLAQAPIAQRWDWDEESLQWLREWLRQAGVHWGLDALQRKQLGLAGPDTHSLEAGLRRLVLAYALPDGNPSVLGDTAAAGAIDGAQAHCLGQLIAWAQAITALRSGLSQPRTGLDWAAFLQRQLDIHCDTDSWPTEAAQVRAAITAMGEAMHSAELSRPLPAGVMLRALTQALDQSAQGGVPTGRVSFAPPSSLRGLPFRWVCVLGLEAGVFPAAQRPSELDLLAQSPRRGDPQRREDQRNIFLDLMLAARDGLHLSHVGRGQTDNAVLAPSVLLAELLEVLVPAIAADPDSPASLAEARARLVVEHPLQPLSERAYRVDADPRLRSHDTQALQILLARRDRGPIERRQTNAGNFSESAAAEDDEATDSGSDALAAEDAFVRAPLPLGADMSRDVEWGDWIRFWLNPADAFLRQRLGLQWPALAEDLSDSEPWDAAGLGRARLIDRLLRWTQTPEGVAATADEGAAGAELRSWAAAQPGMPPGALGQAWLDQEWPQLRAFSRRLMMASAGCGPALELNAWNEPLLRFEVAGETWRLWFSSPDGSAFDRGASRGQHQGTEGLLLWHYGRESEADRLRLWLTHLARCALSPGAPLPEARWVGRESVRHCRGLAAEDARSLLNDLMRGYVQGQQSPLPFFPRAAWAFMEKGEDLRAAQQDWQGTGHSRTDRPESADPATALAWRGRTIPWADDFSNWARRVYGPLRRESSEGGET